MQESLLKSCAAEFGTPLYVYDFDKISAQFEAFKNAFKARKSLICYALKANPNLSVIQHLSAQGAGADCVSIGEVRRALLSGVPKYKIIFSGVGKRDDEILEALQSDILFLNVESEAELLRIESIAQSIQKVARISVRVNPNIDAKTHPYISTGLHENKFGVDIESAKKLYIYAKKSQFLDPVGIHFHIGSQLTELSPIIQGAQKVAELAHSLLALKIELKFFDVGGGIGICYENEKTINLYDYAQGILGALKGLDVTIICEPGRFLVAESGVLLTKVLYEKYNEKKCFIIVDAAMNDLMRPTLYDAVHKVRVLDSKDLQNGACASESGVPDSIAQGANKSKADIVGAICESSDFLAKGVEMPPLAHGDLLCFANAGAYGFSMAHSYNTRPRAAEVGVQNGKAFLIREREKFEDLIAPELKFLSPQDLNKNTEGK
ncbi:diaminopimelate decarboxylase [Helicobacter sp. MIT 00-7814]|uniref:diaminopimelate decarboxylase n=1 Tax=unclassified Helicobacter TaxID=2593540 RepID=UPI000E1F4ADD|nr:MULTISPECIES: diaminopimelate decarboxylase [unclassified Helicobacter]RDU52065.1 diaminopimelate decarboxylase [Helicobacter sp. MIT 00-7814]RDU52087.1 diaminopimelate decarboxylase [Helicobacter sp. MIT 99-10781]